MNEALTSSYFRIIVLKCYVSHKGQMQRDWALVPFLASPCSVTDLCCPYHRRCLRHPKPSKRRATSSSSGRGMARKTTSHQWHIQSCFLPQMKENWCTWRGGHPPSLTWRSWKCSLDPAVYLLGKCWQSVCTMYMKEANPFLLVTAEHVLSLCNSKWMFTLFVREGARARNQC